MPGWVSCLRRAWFWVFVSGVLLFFLSQRALLATSNLVFAPAVILIGATVVPASFTTYTYECISRQDMPFVALIVTFLGGGGLGLIVAGVLEFVTLGGSGAISMFGVGLIEEGAKLIFPLVLFARGRYRSEADGLLIGIASGMGFAALETMGYGLTALVRSGNNPAALQETLLIRGLLSPAGHAAWTGLLVATVWRERKKAGYAVLNGAIIGTFFLVALLHAFWNISSGISSVLGPQWVFLDVLGLLTVALISFILLVRRMRRVRYAEAYFKTPDEDEPGNRAA